MAATAATQQGRESATQTVAPPKPASVTGGAGGAPAGMPAYLQAQATAGGTARGVKPVELKGITRLDDALDESVRGHIDAQEKQRAEIPVRFGNLAGGLIPVRKRGKHYRIVQRTGIRLQHALFRAIEDEAAAPQLFLHTASDSTLGGFVGIGAMKYPSQLATRLRKAPDLIGLAGFDLPSLRLENRLQKGHLRLGVKGARFRLGGAFSGTFDLGVVDETVTFDAQADVRVKGLEEGKLSLKRNEKGLVTGEISVAAKLSKSINGNVKIVWNGRDLTGTGKLGYQGGKFSGEVIVEVLAKDVAARREQGAKAPEQGEAPAAKQAKAPKRRDLVVFGEGNLDFAFTDWLTGTAHVIIDAKGHLTVIGKITPQKEYELFPQKDYVKELFKVEARARYGIPVVGNIFIFANIGMDAFAKLGPAKLYKISISGTYSTDPKKKQDFRIQGSLNISAAAGLRLRGEAGAGLEVLDHDIKAGAGVNGIAGIRGYAEATPVIGYREKQAEETEDKQGEFFIRGDLEMAGQPFLALSGDLFVEIDAPWWSPVPDKRWTWPLGGKEWPIGGSFGITASVDYVFGSKQWPSIEFGKADFDADKFITDLYNDKAKPRSAKGEQPGKWKEKNTPKSEPPKEGGKKGDAAPGKPPQKGKAKPRVEPGTAKRSGKPADPDARTADGKAVRQYQEEARKKKGKIKDDSLSAAGNATGQSRKDTPRKDDTEKWNRGGRAVAQALAYAEKSGIDEKSLNRILKSIRKEFGFRTLTAKRGKGREWIVYGSMSPERVVTTVPEGEPELPKTQVSYGELQYGFGSSMLADPLTSKGEKGGAPSVSGGYWTQLVKRRKGGSSYYVRGHLLNHNIHGPGNRWENLSPITRQANSQHERDVESQVKKAVDRGAVLTYSVRAEYGRALRSDLLDAIERDTAADSRIKSVRKEIVEAEQFVPLQFVCTVKARKAPPDVTGLPISKKIPVRPEQSSPSDYEVSGTERVSYRLRRINLNRPVPSGYRGDERAVALEAYRQLPGIGESRAHLLYVHRGELVSKEAVASILRKSTMPHRELEKWWGGGMVSFDGDTRWEPPRGNPA